MESATKYSIKNLIANALFEALNASGAAAELVPSVNNIEEWLETPKNPDMGDCAFPCFKLAKALRKAPPAIASELLAKIAKPDGIEKIEAVGGYLNFFAEKSGTAKHVLESIFAEGAAYGGSTRGEGKNVVVEYSSINIAKPFGIAHLNTTVIGNSLARIFKHLGYNSVSINHLGDWGTQFGKMIVAYKKWGDRSVIEKDPVQEFVKLYVRFHEEAEKNPALDDEAREWFCRIERHDPEAWELFTWFKDETLKDVAKVYDLLGVKFDSYAGESFYEDKMPPIIDELREKGISKVDNGATIVDLSEWNMPPCIILKSDGSTIYATRDIAAAEYRKKTYDFSKLLYVVAYQQNLHFQQFFKVLELMGREWVKDCVHVNFGMVRMEGMTFSTRKGNIIYLKDVLNASIEKTLEIIKQKSPDLENKEEVARQVGVGAVIWGVLYNGRIKDVVFSWDKALNFDGETGPYAQYTHARCCSVLRKAPAPDTANIDYSALTDEYSDALIRALGEFPNAVAAAAEKYEPYLISRSVIEICSCFNRFYFENRIMDESPAVMNARLALTAATASVIKTGLSLVGLEAPERM